MTIEDLTYVESAVELRPPYRAPSVLARAKQIDRLDTHCRDFIARSPLVIIGSAGPLGPAEPVALPPSAFRRTRSSALEIRS